MQFHPILFSTPMVQSILTGSKTQTRRTNNLKQINESPDDWEYIRFWNGYAKFCERHNHINEHHIKCPYGLPGDVLWVRESITILYPVHCISEKDNRFVYKANMCPDDKVIRKEYVGCGYPYKWKPSIHMPKEACRIFLQVNAIQLERLQSITSEDAVQEGIRCYGNCNNNLKWYKNYLLPEHSEKVADSAKHSFQTLWQKINGPQSWSANPWVWVAQFKQIQKPEGFL